MSSSLRGPKILSQTWLCTLGIPPSTKESKAGGRPRVGSQPKLCIVNSRLAWVMWQAIKKKKKVRRGGREGGKLMIYYLAPYN